MWLLSQRSILQKRVGPVSRLLFYPNTEDIWFQCKYPTKRGVTSIPAETTDGNPITTTLSTRLLTNLRNISIRISPRRIYHRTQNKQNRSIGNLISVKISKAGPPSAKVVPKCPIINATSLAKSDTVSALTTNSIEVTTNNIDTCFISETWLNYKIPSSLSK